MLSHQLKTNIDLGQDLHLIIVSDVHADAAVHAKDAWSTAKKIISETTKAHPTIIAHIGDHAGFTTGAFDPRYHLADIHPQFSVKDMAEFASVQTQIFKDDMQDISGHAIGTVLVQGNHEYQWHKRHQLNPTKIAAEACGGIYLGSVGILSISNEYSKRHTTTFNIGLFHGDGRGSSNPTYPITYCREYFRDWCNLDLCIVGHWHKMLDMRLDMHEVAISGSYRLRPRTLVSGGSFMKKFVSGEAGYGERGWGNPDVGFQDITLTPYRIQKGGRDHTSFFVSSRKVYL